MKTLKYLLCLLQISTIFATTTATFDINSLLVPQKAVKFKGLDPNSILGVRVRDAGDFNNDGYNDIIIGSPAAYGGSGVVFLVYGKPSLDLSDIDFSTPLNPLTTGFTIKGRTTVVGNFGKSVAGVGDVNGDQIDDIIIGAPLEYGGNGAAFIIYGKTTNVNMDLETFSFNPSSTGFEIRGSIINGNLGYTVSGAGDFNGDGKGDILLGAPKESNSKGAVYVLCNLQMMNMAMTELSTLLSSSTGFKILGGADWDQLGSQPSSLNSAGDVNSDKCDDIIIGTPFKSSNKGMAYVIYGKKNNFAEIDLSSSLSLSMGFTITGHAVSDQFGYSVSRAGKINNDKYGDIVIGAPYKRAVYVIYGGQGMTNIDLSNYILDPSTTGFMISGEQGGTERFGTTMKAGDINNDGYDDLFISAFERNANEGAVYVIYGGLDPSIYSNIDVKTLNPLMNGFWITGLAGSSFGNSLDVGVDVVNGVKRSKLLVGASLAFGGDGGVFVILPWKICSANCDICNYPTSCSVCSSGYGLENSQCILCPTGKYLSASGFCLDCLEGCSECLSDINCIRCEDGYTQVGSLCLGLCKKGKYFSNGKCKSCPVGCSECTSNSICQACHEGYTLSDSQLCDKNEIDNDREKAISGAFEGTSIAGAAFGSGSSLPINFGLVAKILRNVKYLNISVSEELEETFHSWKVSGGFLKAPKSWSQESSSKPLPIVFRRYGLDPVFLINYWKPFIMTLIGFALFVIFKVIETLMMHDGDGGKQNSSIPRKINIAASNFALTQIYSNLDDVIFYFILDIRSSELDGVFRGFSLALAVIMLLIGGVILGIHAVFLRKYQNLKMEKTQQSEPEFLQIFRQKFENMKLIFEDFKDITLVHQSFLLIQLFRSLVCSFLFVLLFEYPLLQILLLLIVNLGMIIFLILKTPFKDLMGTFSQLFCEIVLLLANICMLIMAIFDATKSHSIGAMKHLSRAVVVLNVILLIGCAILMVIGIIKSFYTSYQETKKEQTLKLKTVGNNKLDDRIDERIQNQSQGSNYYNPTQQEYSQNRLYSTGGVFHENVNESSLSNSNSQFTHFQEHPRNENFEQQQLGSNTSFSHQMDDTMNRSHANLLPYNDSIKAGYLPKPRIRGKIKMPGGVEFQPRLYYETPINEFQNPPASKPSNIETLNRNMSVPGFESQLQGSDPIGRGSPEIDSRNRKKYNHEEFFLERTRGRVKYHHTQQNNHF